ncbi:MAG: DUF3696 domain-containing protein [Colwellia sp.]
MKIKKLTLTNFRSFEKSQVITFAPVTLLFGPNSVGKSTILMAFAYIQQILQKGHCDPLVLDALGDKNIGGFKSLVHGMDLSKSINIKIEFEPEYSISTEYEVFAELINRRDTSIERLEMPDVAGQSEKIAVEFEIAWSALYGNAYVKNYKVWVNDIYIGKISSEANKKQAFISELNLQHPLLLPDDYDTWLENAYDVKDISEADLSDDDWLTEFEKILIELSPSKNFLENIQNIDVSESELDEKDIELKERKLRIAPISIACFTGAIPFLNKMLETNLDGEEVDVSEAHYNRAIISRVLTQIFVSPLDKLNDLFSKSAYIGPLRTIPSVGYQPDPYPQQKDWMTGKAAWDVLHSVADGNNDLDKLLANVSSWFESEDRFNSGYSLVSRTPRNQFICSNAEILDSLSEDKRARLIASHDEKSEVFFHDLKNGIDLFPNQLGVGISQVLPVVVAAHHNNGGIVAVEQPELHTHPAFQVEIGDLFTQLNIPTSRRPMFLIETHSEHLMLRILKRIRQTTDKELEEGAQEVKPEDISIVYLDDSSGDVVVSKIDIDEDGEFKQRWPKGFFAERREELM